MKNISFLFCFALLLAFTSCDNKKAQSSETGFPLGESFNVKMNETARIKGENMTIKFVAVPAESRCPEGVNCIRAGEVKVRLDVTSGGNTKSVEMEKAAKSRGNVSATVGSYKIDLNAVNPYPKEGGKPKLEDYNLDLVVTKN